MYILRDVGAQACSLHTEKDERRENNWGDGEKRSLGSGG